MSHSKHNNASHQDEVPVTENDETVEQAVDIAFQATAALTFEELEKKYSELQAKHTDVSDAFLRAKAEIENVRKRAREEEARARKFAVEGFAKALLPVKDSLEAALNTPDQNIEALTEGVEITLKQLSNVFINNHLLEVTPQVGDKMDPNLHQAITAVPSNEYEANCIIEVLQKGYSLADRIIRPAMVIVASTPQE